MDYENIIYSVQDGVAIIRINRPKAMNALNSAVNREILDAIEKIGRDATVRVLIITGSAKALAAGADVIEMATASPSFAKNFCEPAIDINNKLEALPIPVIAAVGGYALGGGCEMALACDFRVGGPHTVMAFPEVGLGIIPGANGNVRATQLLGPSKAKELVMLTTKISGKEAYDLGLLNWYVEAEAAEGEDHLEKEYEAIMSKTMEIAGKLIKKPAKALAAAKAVINRASIETARDGKLQEIMEVSLLFDTNDQKEGMQAMIQKRKPEFTNS